MGHGIKEHDIGYCKGTTWHNLPQYAQLDRAVTLDEALKVFEFEADVEKLPNHVVVGDQTLESNSYSIVRKDKNVVLNGAVGHQYTLSDMTDITKLAYGQIVDAFNDAENEVEIETVGTLSNGACKFLSMSFDTHKVYGDESETKNRLMVTDDVRGGGIKTLLSQIRTVCANTRAWAIQSASDIKTTRHTRNCNDKVKSFVIDMAQIQLDMLNQRELLDSLAKADPITTYQQKVVLDAIYPINEDSKRLSPNVGRQDAILQVFNDGQDGLDGKYSKTPYAFLNAITNRVCREEGRSGTSGDWDNIAGRKAELKEVAVKTISNVCL